MANFNQFFKGTPNKENKEVRPRWSATWIHYSKLKRNKFQYADPKTQDVIQNLADLIEAEGQVLQNLIVRKCNADEYEIIAGHKRTAACEYLVKERGLSRYEFLPCIIMDKNDVRAEFTVYSSNAHYEETPYQVMHRIERMKSLIENFPEQFPEIANKGRTIEKLAALLNQKRSTITDYQTIAHNLGAAGMEAFEKGDLTKSAALSLSSLPEDEQEKLIDAGMTRDMEIKGYKKEKKKEVSGHQKNAKKMENVPESGTKKGEVPERTLENNHRESSHVPIMEPESEESQKTPSQFTIADIDMNIQEENHPEEEKVEDTSQVKDITTMYGMGNIARYPIETSFVGMCPQCGNPVNSLFNKQNCGNCGCGLFWE